MTILCQPPDPDPRPPSWDVPLGSVDCHFHVFGPAARYPSREAIGHDVPDASSEAAMRLFETIGMSRAVIVQPSTYGTDNARQLDAMKQLSIETRAVVVVSADVPDRVLRDFHDAGVRGVRMIAGKLGAVPFNQLERIAERVKEMDWHIEFLIWPEHLVELERRIAVLPCRFVIDHLSFIAAERGLSQPAFAALLRLARNESCWLKLSAANRLSHQSMPYDDLVPFAEKLMNIGIDRYVWGSDWPHTNFFGTMPNTTDLLDLLAVWQPDASLRKQILVDNPCILYGFEPAGCAIGQACQEPHRTDTFFWSDPKTGVGGV